MSVLTWQGVTDDLHAEYSDPGITEADEDIAEECDERE